jgi:hypothetical protein
MRAYNIQCKETVKEKKKRDIGGVIRGSAWGPDWSCLYFRLVLPTMTRSPKAIPVEGTGTKGRAFSPRLAVLVRKLGLVGVSQPGLKPTPALVFPTTPTPCRVALESTWIIVISGYPEFVKVLCYHLLGRVSCWRPLGTHLGVLGHP